MIIIAKSPTRLGLFGGGTDIEPFASHQNGQVINIAINLRHQAVLTSREDRWVYVEAMGEKRFFPLWQEIKYGKDTKFDLIYSIINYYKLKLKTGFSFIDEFDGIQSGGLGSSASAAVSMMGAFNKWLGIEMTPVELAMEAWKREFIDLGWASGKQDQLTASFGGFNRFQFALLNAVDVLPLDRTIIDSFMPWFVLFFTGKTRHSASIQSAFHKEICDKTNKGKPLRALCALRDMVDEAFGLFLAYDFQGIGKLMDQSWELKKKSNPLATTDHIDKVYDYAKKRGALGGKVLGAGGEGHMLFVVSPKRRKLFIEEMETIGLKQIDFSPDWNGLEVRQI